MELTTEYERPVEDLHVLKPTSAMVFGIIWQIQLTHKILVKFI